MKLNIRFKTVCISGMLLFLLTMTAAAQSVQISASSLTRGRLWTSTYGIGTRTNAGILPVPFSYPGYYKANEDLTYFGTTNGISAIWTIGGQKTLMQIRGDYSEFVEKEIVPFSLHRNYNFEGEGGIDAPEEWYEGTVELKAAHPNNPSQKLGKLQLRSKSMVWSVPKYDDFVIEEMCVTNMDSETITDFYYSYEFSYYANSDFINDKEYIYEEDINAFIFYDDTSMPIDMNGEEVQYLIAPGNETGDRGNPGNIREMGSLDFAFQDPAAFAVNAIDVTPNKYGEEKVWFNVASRHENARSGIPAEMSVSHPLTPQHETAVTFNATYDEVLRQITTEQEKAGWRDLWEDASRAKDGSVDGNLYERSPIILMSVGPYDLAPGDSAKWIVIKTFGEMERDRTQKGGSTTAKRFQKNAVKELIKNYEAAAALVDNNYQLPAGDYPPPTCGLPPFASDDENLEISSWAEFDEEGIGHQGFELIWNAIHLNYADPGSGNDDFVGYRVYRSEINITGPWEEIAEIEKAQADSLVEGDKIVYRFESDPSVPYRFAVVSYDNKKQESGMTAYTYYSHQASAPVGDDLSVIKVLPNPFRQRSGLLNKAENNRITFLNVPTDCTLRIYTLAGDLVKTIEHSGLSEVSWGSSEDENYMLTDSYEQVAPGLYIFHVESHVAETDGQTYIGKFMIIK